MIDVIFAPGTGPFVDGLAFELKPGVNLLHAPNGTGKTYAMQTLNLFSLKRLKAGMLRTYDDRLDLTAEVVLGTAAIRAEAGGKPEAENLRGAPPVELLPDLIRDFNTGKGFDDADAANRARMAALLKFVGLDADDDLVEALFGDAEVRRFANVTRGALAIEAATAIRKKAQELRRKAEKDLELKKNEHARVIGQRAQALGSYQAADVENVEPSAEAQRRLDEAQRAHILAEEQRKNGLRQQDERERMREAHGARPDLSAVEEDARRARAIWDESATRVRDLQRQLEAAQAELSIAVNGTRNAESALATAREEQERWDKVEATLGAALAFPSEAEVEEARLQLEAARHNAAIDNAVREFRRFAPQLERIEAEISAITSRIDQLDAENWAVWRRLGEAVNVRLKSDLVRVGSWQRVKLDPAKAEKVATEGETVLDEVLYRRDAAGKVERYFDRIEINVEGRWVDIADPSARSEGQLDYLCYRLLAESRNHCVICIEGACTLDPLNLERLSQLAAPRGVHFLLESPDSEPGMFSIEHYPKGGQS